MFNNQREENLAQVQNLISNEGYTDLGWAINSPNSVGFKLEDRRESPIRELDCSMYSKRGTHKVYVDDISKEILHVDLSD